MDELALKALTTLRKIKSVTFASIDGGEPAARIIDIMRGDKTGLYFFTGRGKPFRKQLAQNPTVAVSAMPPDYVAIRLVGEAELVDGSALRAEILADNPVITNIYPDGKDDVLDLFLIGSGRGELFDLSSGPPIRQRFGFGGVDPVPPGFKINDECIACGDCAEACPVGAVSEGEIYLINGARCLECGRCAIGCPVDAIEEARGL